MHRHMQPCTVTHSYTQPRTATHSHVSMVNNHSQQSQAVQVKPSLIGFASETWLNGPGTQTEPFSLGSRKKCAQASLSVSQSSFPPLKLSSLSLILSSPTSLFAQISHLLSQHCVVTGTLHVTVSGLALLPFWNGKTWSSRTTFQPTVKLNLSAWGAASLALLCCHAAGDTGRWNSSATPPS